MVNKKNHYTIGDNGHIEMDKRYVSEHMLKHENFENLNFGCWK